MKDLFAQVLQSGVKVDAGAIADHFTTLGGNYGAWPFLT
jgi:hypothetical protein